VLRETLARSVARWGGSPVPGVPAGHFSARISGEFVPDLSGTWELSLSSAGDARLLLDERVLAETSENDRFFRQGANEVLAEIDLEAGSRHRLVADFRIDTGAELAGLRIGARPKVDPDAEARAVQAAREADVALVGQPE
jgi:beta-glucosidase